MPKFETPEALQAWKEKCAATRARNQKLKQAKPVELSNGFQDETTTKKGRPLFYEKKPSHGILGAVEEIDSKIAALNLVRKNLLHAHELVSA